MRKMQRYWCSDSFFLVDPGELWTELDVLFAEVQNLLDTDETLPVLLQFRPNCPCGVNCIGLFATLEQDLVNLLVLHGPAVEGLEDNLQIIRNALDEGQFLQPFVNRHEILELQFFAVEQILLYQLRLNVDLLKS